MPDTILPVPISGLYAALCALILVALAAAVVAQRLRLRVSLGDGGHHRLQRAIRAHGNFAEYVPIALLLMALLELNAADSSLLHGLGVLLVLGRLSHAYAIHADKLLPRQFGMVATWGALLFGAGALLVQFFQ